MERGAIHVCVCGGVILGRMGFQKDFRSEERINSRSFFFSNHVPRTPKPRDTNKDTNEFFNLNSKKQKTNRIYALSEI